MTSQTPGISLREITPANFAEIISLKVSESQKNFVASNMYSLAEAYVFRYHRPLAIYADETPVGFLMYTYVEERAQHWIFRLMIAEAHQRRGYGREAMRMLIEHMRATPGCRQIYISYEPENNGARTLYTSLGFCITGEYEGEEEVARLDLE